MKHYVPVANGDLSFRSIGRDANIFACHYWHHKSISSASIVRETTVFQPQLFLLYQPLRSLWYKMYACPRTHYQRQKRAGVGEIIARRTITIIARTGTSGTATASGTITILYRCFIPLGLLDRGPPITETLLGWGR